MKNTHIYLFILILSRPIFTASVLMNSMNRIHLFLKKQLYQYLTLKIQYQGHECNQMWRSYSGSDIVSMAWHPARPERGVLNREVKNFRKNDNFGIKKKNTQHMTHLVKLADRFCKYKMDQATVTITLDKGWIRFCPQMMINLKAEGMGCISDILSLYVCHWGKIYVFCLLLRVYHFARVSYEYQ